MRYIRKLITILALFLLIGNVSAEDSYDVTLTILRPNNMDDLENTTWSKYDEITIDKDERVTSIHKIMILDVSLSTDTIFVEIIKDGERFTNFIKEGEAVTFGDEDDLDFKIRVDSIEIKTLNGDGITVSDDDVVLIWVAPNSMDRLYINPFIPESFNPSEYGSTSGWSGTGSLECVDLYIERVQSVSSIGMSITGGDWEEIGIDTINRRKFELNENGVYIITVNYETVDVWGGVKDETETYTLSVTGLAYGTNTGSTSTSITYEDRTIESFTGTTDKYIIVETGADGTWEEVDGATTKFDAKTATGTYSWKIKFDTDGNHKVGFSGIDGASGYYRFIVRESTPAPAATEIVTDQTASDGKSSTGTAIALIGLFILIGGVAVFLNKKSREKKNKGNMGGNRISPETDT